MPQNFTPLAREQYALLFKAKRLVSKEFESELTLQDPKVIERIREYAQLSSKLELRDIYDRLSMSQAQVQTKSVSLAKTAIKSPDELKVGDMVDGKTLTGFYRGQPVFK